MSKAVVRKLTNDRQRSNSTQNAWRVSRFTFDVSTVESIRDLYSGIYNNFVASGASHKSNIYYSRFDQKNVLSVDDSVPTAYYKTAEIFRFCILIQIHERLHLVGVDLVNSIDFSWIPNLDGLFKFASDDVPLYNLSFLVPLGRYFSFSDFRYRIPAEFLLIHLVGATDNVESNAI